MKYAHGIFPRKLILAVCVCAGRFELPFKIVCNSCSTYLGAGIRYNAQKRKVGNYYSTPIYAFRCKCHVCQAWFELRTDPKVR